MLQNQPSLLASLWIDGKYARGSYWRNGSSTLSFTSLVVAEAGQTYTADLAFAALVSCTPAWAPVPADE
jgi:hypothetical protein